MRKPTRRVKFTNPIPSNSTFQLQRLVREYIDDSGDLVREWEDFDTATMSREEWLNTKLEFPENVPGTKDVEKPEWNPPIVRAKREFE